MITNKKWEYAAPVCRVYSVMVESVIAASGTNSSDNGYDDDNNLGEI